MVVKKVTFVKSSQNISQCPPENLPEYAFIGRSNVGKSSLINMLAGVKNLAKTSSIPGKTQLINHFNFDDTWYLVDLPGYGFARISKSKREEFSEMNLEYLQNRKNLLCTFVLVDSRHKPQKIDLKFLRLMGEKGLPFAIVFTKVDKLRIEEIEQNIEDYKSVLLEEWEWLPQLFVTSSEKREGRNEILNYILDINDEWEKINH